jgi:AcrR family transcriptional regulator
MNSVTRRAKEKEALKALILKGAKKLFLEKGIEQTTLRNIADEIDYSVGTIYVYFKDKNEILHALHSIGFQELGSHFAPLFSIADPMERLKKMGMLYIKFALENSEMYDLMFNVKAPIESLEDCVEKTDWDEGANTFGALKQTVSQCMEQGYFANHQLEPLSFMIWSTVHGMCCLKIRNRISGVKFQNADTILYDGYNEMIKMLERS